MKQFSIKIHGFLDRFRVLSGAQLKYIAMLSMLLDHANKALIYPYLNGGMLLVISDLFDILGRIAFPLYCFLLVEGFFETQNRKKYLLRLLVFGVISEIPFNLCATGTFFNSNWNNVMFTLAAVFAAIWLIDRLKKHIRKTALWILASLPILGAFCLFTMVLGLDYEHHAILIGYFFYLFRSAPLLTIPCGFASMYKEPWALLGFFLTLTYNGARGKQSKALNYWFYPAHLLLLGILRLILGV